MRQVRPGVSRLDGCSGSGSGRPCSGGVDRCAGPVGSAVSCHLRGHRWLRGRFGRAWCGWMDALEVGVVGRAPGVWPFWSGKSFVGTISPTRTRGSRSRPSCGRLTTESRSRNDDGAAGPLGGRTTRRPYAVPSGASLGVRQVRPNSRPQSSDRASSHAWRVANTMRRAANASPRIRTSGCRCLSSRYRPSLPMPPHASTTLSNPSSTDRRPL